MLQLAPVSLVPDFGAINGLCWCWNLELCRTFCRSADQSYLAIGPAFVKALASVPLLINGTT